MFVVEFRFAAARILHDEETERQREGETRRQGNKEKEKIHLLQILFRSISRG
jgi:hypothetical protein